jgi:hypothetical protein
VYSVVLINILISRLKYKINFGNFFTIHTVESILEVTFYYFEYVSLYNTLILIIKYIDIAKKNFNYARPRICEHVQVLRDQPL